MAAVVGRAAKLSPRMGRSWPRARVRDRAKKLTFVLYGLLTKVSSRALYGRPGLRPSVAVGEGRLSGILRGGLLKHVFEIGLESGPNCGGELKVIAAILESAVIERILTHLELQALARPGHRHAETFSRRLDGGPARRGLRDWLRLARVDPRPV